MLLWRSFSTHFYHFWYLSSEKRFLPVKNSEPTAAVAVEFFQKLKKILPKKLQVYDFSHPFFKNTQNRCIFTTAPAVSIFLYVHNPFLDWITKFGKNPLKSNFVPPSHPPSYYDTIFCNLTCIMYTIRNIRRGRKVFWFKQKKWKRNDTKTLKYH